jgi:hypothetical protein
VAPADLYEQLELAASVVNDGSNLLRGTLAGRGRVPAPHRRQITSALRHLEPAASAQLSLGVG